MEDRAYWVAIRKIPGIGPRRFQALLNYFGRAEEIWRAAPAELSKAAMMGPRLAENFAASRSQVSPEQEMEALYRHQVGVLIITDMDYPEYLKQIYDPPPVLFFKGKLLPEDNKALAIVGSRRATPFGRAMAEKLAAGLARAGICVVSGLARGIDSAAHKGAIETNGRTIGVLGCGLDVIYPRENRALYRKIEENGAVLSEFPLGTQPEPSNFPARNRVISGLSRGVVVVESADDGGALITADFALEQGRDVFAVPGPASNRYSVGPNRLIEEGARPVEDALSILCEYGWQVEEKKLAGMTSKAPAKSRTSLKRQEKRIINMLSFEPKNIENIREMTGFSPAQLAAQLMLLEIKGIVIKLPGGQYILKRDFV